MAKSPKKRQNRSKTEVTPVTPDRSQGALLDSTATYRVYVSGGLEAVGKAGKVLNKKGAEELELPPNGVEGATFLQVDAKSPSKIVCHVGPAPDGKTKAVYLVLVPESSQITKP